MHQYRANIFDLYTAPWKNRDSLEPRICDFLCDRKWLANVTLPQQESRQKEFGKKWQKSDGSIRKSDQKVTERVPKTKKVIELLLPTSFAAPWEWRFLCDFSAWKYSHCGSSLQYLVCGVKSLANGDAWFWCIFSASRFNPRPQCLPIFHLLLGGWSESLLRNLDSFSKGVKVLETAVGAVFAPTRCS